MTKRFGPLTKVERSRIVEAVQFARTEPERMRPMLNEAEAATLDMMRRLRAAQADAAPSVSRLAEYLSWSRSAGRPKTLADKAVVHPPAQGHASLAWTSEDLTVTSDTSAEGSCSVGRCHQAQAERRSGQCRGRLRGGGR